MRFQTAAFPSRGWGVTKVRCPSRAVHDVRLLICRFGGANGKLCLAGLARSCVALQVRMVLSRARLSTASGSVDADGTGGYADGTVGKWNSHCLEGRQRKTVDAVGKLNSYCLDRWIRIASRGGRKSMEENE